MAVPGLDPGIDPAIHVFPLGRNRLAAPAIGETSDKGVDGRDKPGHDGMGWRVVYFAKSAP
jgi:hypothetical protein